MTATAPLTPLHVATHRWRTDDPISLGAVSMISAAASGSSRGRKLVLQMRREKPKWIARTVATSDGILTIVPHFMAQGMIDAMVELGKATESLRHDYDLAGTEAMKQIAVPFPFPSDEWWAWMKAAIYHWGDVA